MALRDPDSIIGPFRERNTVLLSATVKDNADPQVPIPGSALDSIVYTLYLEKRPYTIINARNNVDISSLVDVNGALEIELDQDDMAMVGSRVAENHRLLLEWEWDGGKYGSWEIRIQIENVLYVP